MYHVKLFPVVTRADTKLAIFQLLKTQLFSIVLNCMLQPTNRGNMAWTYLVDLIIIIIIMMNHILYG